MKIIIINASFRKNGATARILSEFANQLNLHADTDVEIFHLSDLNIGFCHGCCSCYKTGQCFLEDDANMLVQAIVEADGLVIGTPNYVTNISGQLKTFFDRAHFVLPQLLKDKHTIGVVTYENVMGGSVFSVLKKMFVLSGAKTVDKIIAKIPLNSNPIESEKVKANIKNKAVKFHNSILRKKAKSLPDRIMHFFAFNLVIKPFVLKKGQEYQGVLQHWKAREISHK